MPRSTLSGKAEMSSRAPIGMAKGARLAAGAAWVIRSTDKIHAKENAMIAYKPVDGRFDLTVKVVW